MPLAQHYRLQVYNGTGVSVTCTVTSDQWKFDSNGAMTFAAETTPISSASVSAGAYSNSSTIDNSSNLYLGANFTVNFAPSASATGTVALYVQESTDGGTTWPDNGQGLFVCGVAFSASSTAVKKNGKFS